MVNYRDFVDANKSIIIAPAGYGKTHTISESLKHTEGKQLILTHTHAGVSSIKEKLKKANIPSQDYNVETITSFAQKYVLSFYAMSDIPEQDDKENYFPFIIEKSLGIFELKTIKKVISVSYTGLFVDEYQDCTESQHNIILALSNILPTHILGDYLQGIFNFKPQDDPIVDLEDTEKLKDFYENFQELETPWRWKIGGNEALGEDLKQIREKLKVEGSINLENYNSIAFHKFEDINNLEAYNAIFSIINDNESLLVIDPISHHPGSRIKFVQKFRCACSLIESIDEPLLYDYSHKIDGFTKELIHRNIIELGLNLFNKTEFKKWFNCESFKQKRKTGDDDKKIALGIKVILDRLETNISFSSIAELMLLIYDIPHMKVYRKDMFFSLIKSMKNAYEDKISVYESMVDSRNIIRRVGDRIKGKSVGTTLLTKGLEFDTVLVINAHLFKCPKDLYVALTRSSNNLIIFSNNNILYPHS